MARVAWCEGNRYTVCGDRMYMQKEIQTESKRIIWKADVMSPEYLPVKVVGREQQRQRLETCLSPIKSGGKPLNAWLCGPAGTGKTALARCVANEVCGGSSDRFVFYMNCWERRSRYSAVQSIAEAMKVLGAEAQNTHVKLERIKRIVKNRAVVVILDNIDRMAPREREDIIYTLLGFANAALICISNRKDPLISLEERTKSRLSPVVVEFAPYTKRELKKILFSRVRDGLLPNTWTDQVLSRLAESAGGDSRVALEALRAAAVAVESSGRCRIALRDCPGSLREQCQIQYENAAQRLPYHERLIYDIAVRDAPMYTTELLRVYRNECRKSEVKPVARRTFSKYVTFLKNRELIALDDRCTGGKGRLLRIAEHGKLMS